MFKEISYHTRLWKGKFQLQIRKKGDNWKFKIKECFPSRFCFPPRIGAPVIAHPKRVIIVSESFVSKLNCRSWQRQEKNRMDENISNLSKSLGCFCNHLEGSCQALKESVQRRPIPLDSASSTFVQCLSRRVTCLTSDVNLLDSMSFGTVSFEELLGHCSEVYKNNQTNLLELQDRLKGFGYVPGM